MWPVSATYCVANKRKERAVLAVRHPAGVSTGWRVPPRQLKGGLSNRRHAGVERACRAGQEARDLGFRRSQRPVVQEGRRRARRRTARRSMSVATKVACGQERSAANRRSPLPAARSAMRVGCRWVTARTRV